MLMTLSSPLRSVVGFWAVDGHMKFLPSLVQRNSTCDFQYVSTVRIMGKAISAFQDGVAFGYFDRHGGHSTEMGRQAVGLYPRKYGINMPVGEDLMVVNIFANHFSATGGQYSHRL